MSPWRTALALLVFAAPVHAASYRTANFAVEAPTPQVAKRIADAAEKHRQAIARRWLGHALPDWPEPCVLNVDAAGERRGGSSTFYFDRGRVLGQKLNIRGPVQELLPKVLPHELTHSIFAHHFGCPVPRWADEGSAILSEDDAERERRDLQMERILLTPDLSYSLAELFDLNDYPRDLRVFYTQSYSVTRFLVGLRDHDAYLAFLACGMRHDWDRAVQTFYDFESVADLDRAWRARLRINHLRRELTATFTPAAPAVAALIRDVGETARDALARMEPLVLFPFLPAAMDANPAVGRIVRGTRPTNSAPARAVQASSLPAQDATAVHPTRVGSLAHP